MNCTFGAAPNPAFVPGDAVISFIQNGRVTLDGIDGIRKGPAPSGGAADAVWSSSGGLAVVRGDADLAGPPGALRLIGFGTEPSWSPDGTQIAVSQGGLVMILDVRNRPPRVLVRGSAPAFSPDGRWIAFVAPDHRLMVIAARGRHPTPKAVGNVQAVSVDWQPQPAGLNPGCPVPPGARTLASSSAALVIGDGVQPPPSFSFSPPLAYMGCLRADGRQRLLETITDNNIDGADTIDSAVLAAPYAALVDDWQDGHYGGRSSTVQVFDLRSGSRQTNLGGESLVECEDFGNGPCYNDAGIRSVVLGSDGVSAVHMQEQVAPPASVSTSISGLSCPTATLCAAVDAGGGDVLTSVNPTGGASAWRSASIVVPDAVGAAIACRSASLCVAAVNESVATEIFTSTDPTGGSAAWASTKLPGANTYINDVSCPSLTLCLAAGSDGGVAVSTNPTGGAGAWSITKSPRATGRFMSSARRYSNASSATARRSGLRPSPAVVPAHGS